MLSLEAPGSWARMTIHDRDLLPLLHDLAVGRPAAEMAAAAVGHSEQAILAVLALMSWCGLLDGAERRRVVRPRPALPRAHPRRVCTRPAR